MELSPELSRLIAGMAKVLEQRALSELYADDVVKEAGVSKRTFYQHFANKEDCFLALYRENSARVLGVLKEASGAMGLSALERIQLGAKAYLAFMQGQSALMKRLYIDILYLGTEGMKAKREVLQQFADVLLAAYDAERALLPSLPTLDPECAWRSGERQPKAGGQGGESGHRGCRLGAHGASPLHQVLQVAAQHAVHVSRHEGLADVVVHAHLKAVPMVGDLVAGTHGHDRHG